MPSVYSIGRALKVVRREMVKIRRWLRENEHLADDPYYQQQKHYVPVIEKQMAELTERYHELKDSESWR